MYLKGWWSVAVWFLLPAWLIKTFNLYVNATWGSYHPHTCTWRKIINSSLMWQLWEFMGIVVKRAAEERLAWWEGSQRGVGRPGPARYRNDLMHNYNPDSQSLPRHARLHITGWSWGLRLFTDVLLKPIIDLFALLSAVLYYRFFFLHILIANITFAYLVWWLRSEALLILPFKFCVYCPVLHTTSSLAVLSV